MNIQFGSVWKVREEVWKLVISGYDQNSTRKSHPGLVIYRSQRRPPAEQRVPTLIGVTKAKGCKDPLALELGDPAKPEGFKTYFKGTFGPIPAGLFDSDYARKHPGARRLNAEGIEQLEQWCRKKQLIS